MNLPKCEHQIPLSCCAECLLVCLTASYRTNSELHRRIQKNEGAAGRLEEARRQHRLLEASLSERKEMLNLLGIAWSLRGSASNEKELTADQVKQLVSAVNRIQLRHFGIEYKLKYASVDDMVRKTADQSVETMRQACDSHWRQMNNWRKRANLWKKLAKVLRSRNASGR